MSDDPFRPPTDAEIDAAEQRLGFTFPGDYRAFLRAGGDVGDAGFEAAVILPGSGHLDIDEIAQEAWELDVPRDLLPIVEDNGDYYCLNRDGGIVYWSHNGSTDEAWPTFAAWFQQVCIEEAEGDDEDDEDLDEDEEDDVDYGDEGEDEEEE